MGTRHEEKRQIEIPLKENKPQFSAIENLADQLESARKKSAANVLESVIESSQSRESVRAVEAVAAGRRARRERTGGHAKALEEEELDKSLILMKLSAEEALHAQREQHETQRARDLEWRRLDERHLAETRDRGRAREAAIAAEHLKEQTVREEEAEQWRRQQLAEKLRREVVEKDRQIHLDRVVREGEEWARRQTERDLQLARFVTFMVYYTYAHIHIHTSTLLLIHTLSHTHAHREKAAHREAHEQRLAHQHEVARKEEVEREEEEAMLAAAAVDLARLQAVDSDGDEDMVSLCL